jgi:triacylglycerol lipase
MRARAIVLSSFLLACGSSTATPGYDLVATSGGGGAAAAAATATSASYAVTATSGGQMPKGPPYPIVLAHGFFGFEKFAGLDFEQYFFGIRDALAKKGEPLVFTPAVDPFNSSAARGAQLAQRIQSILVQTGHAKVNIIGHSQGGLDARVVAHDHPELVASVVTLQTPHQGTPIADVALGLVGDPNMSAIVDAIIKTAGKPIWDQIGESTSLAKPLKLFSKDGIAAFNAAYADAPAIYYASIAGRSSLRKGGADCATPLAPPFVSAWDDKLDPIDALLSPTALMLKGGIGHDYPNDGLVRAKDARWGEFLGCVPADHLDMVGQLLGDGPGIGNPWDYRQFYLDLVAHIRQKGF